MQNNEKFIISYFPIN